MTSREGPIVELKVNRRSACRIVLAAVLARYTVLDISILDPPLDQMIAKVFEEGSRVFA